VLKSPVRRRKRYQAGKKEGSKPCDENGDEVEVDGENEGGKEVSDGKSDEAKETIDEKGSGKPDTSDGESGEAQEESGTKDDKSSDACDEEMILRLSSGEEEDTAMDVEDVVLLE